MPPHDDQPLDGLLAYSRARVEQFNIWLDQLRAGDPAFAEASPLYPDDMNEWQAATYLLTGCDEVWGTVRCHVLADATVAPVVAELEHPRRAWSSSETAVMRWAAHFWDVYRTDVEFPYVFEQFYFQRWMTSCHLYKRIAPALAIAGARR